MSHEVVPPVEGTVHADRCRATARRDRPRAASPAGRGRSAPAGGAARRAAAGGPSGRGAAPGLTASTEPRRPAASFGLASAPDRPAGPGPAGPVQRALADLAGQRGAGAADRHHREHHPKADARLLQRAFDMAARWHSGQYRKSGDPYITHPLAVATILANLGMDTTTLVAALLHDTIEDTDYTLDQMKRGLRRRGRAAGRRRHQARQGQARRRGQGRDDPQDGRGDGQGPAGPGDQAGRPAAQHADADLPAPPQAGAEGQGDAGDPRPAGPPPRYEHDQVGAGGSRLRHAVPEAVRGDQPADRRAPAAARGAAAPGDPARFRSTSRPPRSRRRPPAGRSTCTRSTRR